MNTIDAVAATRDRFPFVYDADPMSDEGRTLERLVLRAAMGDQAAIQNMEFLRRLIEEARAENPAADMARLRMLQGSGMGTDAITTKKGDE